MKRQDKYWLALISIIVLVVGMATYRNQKNQERLMTEAQSQALRELANRQDQANRQDLSTREEIDRQLSETALRNELNSASRRESALQAQITSMDTAKRQGAERELQALQAQRAQLQKQMNCDRIQVSMNQLTAKGEKEQALSLQKQWNLPCPNLRIGD
jgi:hypothetical protein